MNRRATVVVWFLALSCSLAWALTARVSAQTDPNSGKIIYSAREQGGQWSAPVLLFENSQKQITDPFVLADRSDVMHVFWSNDQTTDQGTVRSLFYTDLRNGRWAEPVDILTSPDGGGASRGAAVIDANGRIHVVWSGSRIFYSSAEANSTHDAKAWSAPVALTDSGEAVIGAAIALDPQQNLHVFYGGTHGDVFQLTSLDRGNSWSGAARIVTTQPGQIAGYVNAAFGTDGSAHVSFDAYLPDGSQPIGIYYTSLSGGDAEWSTPLQLANEHYSQSNLAIGSNGTVYAAWDGRAGTGGKFLRYSVDGGKSWPAAQKFNDKAGGLQGKPALVVDSAGTIHMIVANGERQCIMHVSGLNGNSECAVSFKGLPTNYVEEAAASLSLGNQLGVVFWDDRRRLWYAEKSVAAPAETPQPYPASTGKLTPTPESVVPPTLAVQPARLSPLSNTPPLSNENILSPLLITIVPSLLLVMGIFIVLRLRRR